MNDKKIVCLGTPEFSACVLQGLIDAKYNIIAVVTQPDKPVGRKRILTPTPVKEVALRHNIDVYQPVSLRKDYEFLKNMDFDMLITAAYGQILPQEVLDLSKVNNINVHASLLPKLRGGAPIHKSIIDGYDKTGITIMYMDEKMDSGDIISQSETIITDTDNLESVHDRLSLMGSELLLDTLPSIIEGSNNRIKQNEEEVTYAWNIKREEEHIDFSKTRREVFNLIRGLSPVPGANFLLDNQEMKVYTSIISEKVFYSTKVGEITGLYKDGIGVNCSDGEIILTVIKPFGKKKMDAFSYINGLQNKESMIGKVLE